MNSYRFLDGSRPQGEATNEAAALHLEQAEEVILVGEEEEEEEEPVFVLTDEWAEFFAKSDAKRRLGNNHSSSHLIISFLLSLNC